MVRKVYSEEFQRDAVELYRTTEGSTVASIAADLGIVDTTLSAWLKAAGVPIRAAIPGPMTGRRQEASRLIRSWPGCARGSPMSS